MARDGPLMATAFDPSAFIAAEDARRSHTLAAPASLAEWASPLPNSAENCEKLAGQEASLATIATLAAPDRISLPWDDEIDLFIAAPCPPIIRTDAWIELIETTWDVHRIWGAEAFEAGWSMLDLFGCNPDPTRARVDRDGLVAAVTGLRSPVRITALDHQTAVLQPKRGDPMRYYRSPAPGSVPLWVAYAVPTGP